MDGNRFDHLARAIGARLTRRSMLTRFAATGAAGIGATSGVDAKGLLARTVTQADSEEQSVLLLEGLAEVCHGHIGSCDELREKVRGYEADNQELLAQLRAEQGAWTREQRVAHADAYGDRRELASTKLLGALARCGFTDAVTTPAGPTATPSVATPHAKRSVATKSFAQGIPTGTCATSASAECLIPAVNLWGLPDWTSPSFDVVATCPYGTKDYGCSMCQGNDTCATIYPTECVHNGTNVCVLACLDMCVPPPPEVTCCEDNCPPATSDCVLSYFEGIYGDTSCASCFASWCGSTDWCLQHCESEECCDGACHAESPPPMHGH